MGLVDGFLLLGLFFVGLPLAAVVGRVLGKLLHVPRLAGCLPALVLLAILFGVPVSLRVAGARGSARVAEKKESVHVFGYTGSSTHRYDLVLHFSPDGASRADATTRIASSDSLRLSSTATREVFDRTRVGDVMGVVYLPFRPSIGVLAGGPFLSLPRSILAVPEIAFGLLALLGIAVAIALSRITLVSRAPRAMRAVAIAACVVVVLGAGWMTYQNPRSVPESAVDAPAVARIVGVRRIDRTLFSFDNSAHSSEALAQPFDVVEVEFTPPALGQPVHATDAVDVGSVRGLESGTPLSIRYATATPRSIRIAGGARTFRAKNAVDMLQQIAIVGGVLLVLLAFWTVMGRRKRQATPRMSR
jgi:hypothetical protein